MSFAKYFNPYSYSSLFSETSTFPLVLFHLIKNKIQHICYIYFKTYLLKQYRVLITKYPKVPLSIEYPKNVYKNLKRIASFARTFGTGQKLYKYVEI